MKSTTLCSALLASTLLFAGSASAQTYSKTEVITYHDNTSKWVLGQTASVSCTESIPSSTACDGDVVSATSYDGMALPSATYAFGKPQSTMTYNADGTLATVKDGNNKTTTLSNWHRGIPRHIQYADSTTQSAVVNGNGWITSVTDETSYTTAYTHDAMGRLASILYPAGWSNTTRTFVPVTSTEYGIPAGHWRETVTTGQHVKITYYDGMWRPLLVREYDSGAESTTKRYTRMRYDAEGRLVFTSYPTNACTTPAKPCDPTAGVSKAYDELGRVTEVSQTSESGSVGTTTSYEPGFLTVVTDANGNATISSYLTYDQPTTDWPLVINGEEDQTTTISRDPHGKPTSLVRSGGGASVTRSYTYNAHQELCKSVEPETGATLYAYDGAGNLVASAAGQSPSAVCGDGMVNAVGRWYDNRNRLTSLTFPDGNGNQSWSYTPDGLPSSVTTYNNGNVVTNSYTYNNRRFLVSEAMVPDPMTPGWGVSYLYNTLGAVTKETRPGSVTFTYTVNALGQVTQILANSDTEGLVTLASNATYFPNGALKDFTYGNGIVHRMSQNARLLPSRSTDCTNTSTSCIVANRRLDLTYTYDGNGNVAGITDGTTSARQTRGMSYDGLDRLTAVSSPMFGSASYTYDALDNLQQVSIGGTSARDHYYCYNAANQLEFVRSGPLCSSATPSLVYLQYDAQGNVTNKNGAIYNFDHGNRLRGTAGLSYFYDAAGRRVREDNAGSQLKYSYYANDGRLVWQRDTVAGERINYAYLSGTTVAEYMRPIGVTTATITYVHNDALGSPILKTNAAKAVVKTSEYEPYGKLLNGANNDRPGFTGHVMDSASGLTYMQQRYYDPQIGRFLSVDPVTASGGDMRHFNRYAYAYNNPYKFNDPDGRAANFIIKGVIDIGLEVAIQYATTGTVNPRTVLTEVAKGALNPLKTVERARDLARIAKGADKASDAAKGAKTAGRYEFPDKKNGDKPYVGQSCNCERRLDQHQQAGRYEPGTASVTPVEGGKTAREVSEHNRIQEITGGVPARQSDAVSNKVDPIGPARSHLLDEKK
jgi:RHS repeat-associated protein